MSQKSGRKDLINPDETEEEHYSSEQLESEENSIQSDQKSEQDQEENKSEESDWDDLDDEESDHKISEESDNDSDESPDEEENDFIQFEAQNDKNSQIIQNVGEYQAQDDLEYDEEGRPKGVTKLFNLIKEDLGESQSENFKLFYDLMSNQIKYCLQQYINDDDEEQLDEGESQKQSSLITKSDKEKNKTKSIISPMVLLNLIQQQKSLILNVVDSKDKILEQKKQSFHISKLSQESSIKQQVVQLQPSLEEQKIKLKLNPRNTFTKNHMIDKKRNHLIMVNTTNTKDLKVILEYLADKQCEVPINKIILRTTTKRFSINRQGSQKVQDLIQGEKPIEQNEGQPSVFQLMYEIENQRQVSIVGQKRFHNEMGQQKKSKIPNEPNNRELSLLSEEEDEDLNDDDLVQMFTEIFSIILLNKRKKFLKLKHLDKDARLPHPNSLLSKGKKGKSETEKISKKRELKLQLKAEQERLFQLQDQRINDSIPIGFQNQTAYGIPYIMEKQGLPNPEDSQYELFETNPYFHQLMRQRDINHKEKKTNP